MVDPDARLIRNVVTTLARFRPFEATDDVVDRCVAAYRDDPPMLPQDKCERLIDAVCGVLEEVENGNRSPIR